MKLFDQTPFDFESDDLGVRFTAANGGIGWLKCIANWSVTKLGNNIARSQIVLIQNTALGDGSEADSYRCASVAISDNAISSLGENVSMSGEYFYLRATFSLGRRGAC